MNKPTGNQAVVGGGVGGAVATVFVILWGDDLGLDATKAAAMTAALTVLVGWAVRYLPPPKPKP